MGSGNELPNDILTKLKKANSINICSPGTCTEDSMLSNLEGWIGHGPTYLNLNKNDKSANSGIKEERDLGFQEKYTMGE